MAENLILAGAGFGFVASVCFVVAPSIPKQSSLFVSYLWRGHWRALFQLILNCRDGILVFERSILPSAINVIS